MNVNIKVERLDNLLIAEIQEILKNNYAETAHFNIDLDINWDTYLLIGEAFYPIVMRNETNRIVGILFFLIDRYPHIQSLMMAQQITFFVEKEYRRYSLRLLKESENLLREIGIDLIIQSARYDSPLCKILEQKEYEKADLQFVKRIGPWH